MVQISTDKALRRVGSDDLLRRLGVAALPLGIFVVLAYGVHQVSQRWAAAAAMSVATQPPAASSERQTDSLPASYSNGGHAPSALAAREKAAPSAAGSPSEIAAQFRDTRSLLELSSSNTAATINPGQSETSPSSVGAPAKERIVEVTLEQERVTPLGFTAITDGSPGAYAIVRGVPQSAQLSHGISVGNDSWLIDAPEIAGLGIAMRSGVPGVLPLEFTLLAGNSSVLMNERLALLIKAAPVTGQPAAGVKATEPQVVASPTVLEKPAQTPAQPLAPALTLKMADDTELTPGRGSMLRLEIEPATAVPAGTLLLLRGLPADTAVSAGIAVGEGSWLLTMQEQEKLEVRMPTRTTGEVVLDARLISATGQFLAELKHRIVVRQQSRAQAKVATLAPDTGSRAVAAVPAAPAPAQVAAAVAALPIAAPSVAPSPGAPASGKPSADAGANNALTRGRRMLQLGNIAVARPLLEHAAGAGSGEAAALLGGTFDPHWLQKFGVLGLTGDSDKAKHWFDVARGLGTTDIEQLMARLAARR